MFQLHRLGVQEILRVVTNVFTINDCKTLLLPALSEEGKRPVRVINADRTTLQQKISHRLHRPLAHRAGPRSTAKNLASSAVYRQLMPVPYISQAGVTCGEANQTPRLSLLKYIPWRTQSKRRR